MAAITLQDFVTLEDGIAALAKRRMLRLIVENNERLSRVGGSGDRQAVSAALAALQAPAWIDADEKRLRALAGIAARLGAGSISDDGADNWVKPNPNRQTILDLAVTQYQSLERAYLTHEAAAAAERYMAEYEAEQVAKADLVPADFGYVPQAGTPPPWSGVRNAAVEGVLAPSQLAANLTTSRLVNYGGLDAMRVEVVQEYVLKALLDARTSKICRSMNGRKFRVEDGMDLLERAFRVQNPADLKNVHPWVPAGMIADLPLMSNDSLRAKGFYVPPFHPRCRTVVVPSRRSTSTTGGNLFNPAAGLEETVEGVLDDAVLSALAVPAVLVAGVGVPLAAGGAYTGLKALVAHITQGATFLLSAQGPIGNFFEQLILFWGNLFKFLAPKQIPPMLYDIEGSPIQRRRLAAANTILARQYESGVENAMALDRRGRVKWYNDGKEAMYSGARMPEKISTSWHELIHTHPFDMTLSPADVYYSAYASLTNGRDVPVTAYSVSKGIYKGATRIDADYLLATHKAVQKDVFWALVNEKGEDWAQGEDEWTEDVGVLHQHLSWTVLKRLGVVKYTYTPGATLARAYNNPDKRRYIQRVEDKVFAKWNTPENRKQIKEEQRKLQKEYAISARGNAIASVLIPLGIIEKADAARGRWMIDTQLFTSEDFKTLKDTAAAVLDDGPEKDALLAMLDADEETYAAQNDYLLALLKGENPELPKL